MAAPSYSDVEKFASSVGRVSDEARRSFLRAASLVDFTDWTTAAEALREIVEAIVISYGSAAAELGAQWYEYCRSLSFASAYTAKIAEPDRRLIVSDANKEIDKLFAGTLTEGQLAKALSNVVSYCVYGRANETVEENLNYEYKKAVRRGDRTFAKKSGYARVAAPGACAFCVMLASNGFWYTSEKTAGEGNHKNCNCTVVPYANAKDIAGYSDLLDSYETAYSDADKLRRSGDMPDELRERIEKAKEEHQARYAAGETSVKWDPSRNETVIIMRWQNGMS